MKYAPIEIRCPHCGQRAEFHEPFEFVSRPEDLHDREFHRWGGWKVIELFPSVYPWKAPKTSTQFLRSGGGKGGGYPVLHQGMLLCPGCHQNGKHTLAWPGDAYWSWDIRGALLWARDIGHARRILEYIGGINRFRPASRDLRHIPKEFLAAKVRELVVKRITASFTAIGEDPARAEKKNAAQAGAPDP